MNDVSWLLMGLLAKHAMDLGATRADAMELASNLVTTFNNEVTPEKVLEAYAVIEAALAVQAEQEAEAEEGA
jgi:hypothetical protein